MRKTLLGWRETTSTELNNNGETVLVISAATKDGVVNFTLVFAGNKTVYENKTLDGNNYKFSVTIDYSKAPNYSGRNDTSIAIVTVATSKKAVRDIQRVDDTSNGVEVPSGDTSIVGSLHWDTQVSASHNGSTAHFNLTNSVDSNLHNDSDALYVSEGWATQVIYHSISLDSSMTLGNAELYWDPEVGASIDYSSSSTTTSPSSSTTSAPSAGSSATSSASSSVIASIAGVLSIVAAILA